MKSKGSFIKISIVVLILSLSVSLLFGCSSPNKKVPQSESAKQDVQQDAQQSTQPNPQTNSNQTPKNVTLQKADANIDQDRMLTLQLKQEKEVLDGKIYIQGDTVIAAILIKNEIKEADAKKLCQNYAAELKKKYEGKKINVQAVQNGKNIADITL